MGCRNKFGMTSEFINNAQFSESVSAGPLRAKAGKTMPDGAAAGGRNVA